MPLLSIDEAAARLDEDIALAEQQRFEREQALAASLARAEQWEAERARRQAEQDAFLRPTWRRIEHKDDPGPADWGLADVGAKARDRWTRSQALGPRTLHEGTLWTNYIGESIHKCL